MRDPVVAADGYSYEREAIAAWMQRAGTSPLTNLPLQHGALTPNHLLRSAILEWQAARAQGQAGGAGQQAGGAAQLAVARGGERPPSLQEAGPLAASMRRQR